MSDIEFDGLQELTHGVKDLRNAVDLERKAREENTGAMQQRIAQETRNRQESQQSERHLRRRSNRRVLVILGIVIVLTVWFGAQNNSRIDDIERTRLQSQINTCLADNETATRVNSGNEAKDAILLADKKIQAEIDALVEPIKSQPRPSDPTEAARLDKYLATFEQQRAVVVEAQANADTKIAEAHVAARDCSPEAVKGFYSGTGN